MSQHFEDFKTQWRPLTTVNASDIMEAMNNKLYIYLGPHGYNVTTDGITPMEFVDGEQTTDIVDENGKPDLKEAISVCTRHEYTFELIG